MMPMEFDEKHNWEHWPDMKHPIYIILHEQTKFPLFYTKIVHGIWNNYGIVIQEIMYGMNKNIQIVLTLPFKQIFILLSKHCEATE